MNGLANNSVAFPERRNKINPWEERFHKEGYSFSFESDLQTRRCLEGYPKIGRAGRRWQANSRKKEACRQKLDRGTDPVSVAGKNSWKNRKLIETKEKLRLEN